MVGNEKGKLWRTLTNVASRMPIGHMMPWWCQLTACNTHKQWSEFLLTKKVVSRIWNMNSFLQSRGKHDKPFLLYKWWDANWACAGGQTRVLRPWKSAKRGNKRAEYSGGKWRDMGSLSTFATATQYRIWPWQSFGCTCWGTVIWREDHEPWTSTEEIQTMQDGRDLCYIRVKMWIKRPSGSQIHANVEPWNLRL